MLHFVLFLKLILFFKIQITKYKIQIAKYKYTRVGVVENLEKQNVILMFIFLVFFMLSWLLQ